VDRRVLEFDKYEGLGNDFLVVAAGRGASPELARRLCDRHLGVGGDGILEVDAEALRMRVLNADGSVPQMCGNGVRCVALHLLALGRVEAGVPFDLHTDAGPHAVTVLEGGLVEVGMRPPSLAPPDLPLLSDAPWIDEALSVDGLQLRATAVSMGNPHVVLFDQDVDRAALGPRLERDPRFPEGVNVGFAEVTARGLDLEVWERGVGFTQACGTGACAAAVAAVETGRAARGTYLSVRLPGGALAIRVDAPGEPVRMRGPARRVFRGEVPV
jgi:diaminopimelate epimerase